MPEIQYPKNPNTETAFVVRENGKKNRAVMTAPQDISTIEYPNNQNSTKAYVTVNGKKHRVIMTANVAGGGSGGGAVDSVNGKTGAVVLDASDVGALPQISTMPTASSTELGKIVQYVGQDTQDYTNGYVYKCESYHEIGTAIASQTTGSDLTDITVDVEQFEADENPTASGNYAYEYSLGEPTVVFHPEGDTDLSASSASAFDNVTTALSAGTGYTMLQFGYNLDEWYITAPGEGNLGTLSSAQLESCGITIIGTPQQGDIIQGEIVQGDEGWYHNGEIDYNVDAFLTYEGTPADGDVITIAYTAGSEVYYWDIHPTDSGILQFATLPTRSAYISSHYGFAARKIGTGGGYTDGYIYESWTKYNGELGWKQKDVQPGLPEQTAGTQGMFAMSHSDGDTVWDFVATPSTVTLQSNGWTLDSQTNKYTQTVSCYPITGTQPEVVLASPDVASVEDYINNGLLCTATSAGYVTFTADTEPANDIDVNIVRFN